MTQDTWAFIYSAEYGLYLGSEGGYHTPLVNSKGGNLKKILNNIYFGGEVQPGTYTVDHKTALPGTAGRIGHRLTFGKGYDDIWVITFYDHRELSWMPNTVKEIIKQGHAPDTALVVDPERGKVISAKEYLASHPLKSLAKTGPVQKPKTWQGEFAKVMRPGQKWWAPTSEGKK